MIPYPQFDPVLVQLGPLQVRWYGLMYILGFAIGYLILKFRAKETHMDVDKNTLMDFAFYLFVGVLVGGRVGYILFYNPVYFATHPAEVFALWQGGMSFHGGLIGTLVAGFIFCWQQRIDYYRLADAVIPAVPIGLLLGRLGNFINGELWGRPTDVPWAMVFPADPTALPRHPSQLYEAIMEGVILFVILWVMRRFRLPDGVMFWTFICGYGLARLIGELFREPDAHLSFIMPNITAGMILSLPMFLVGLVMIIVRMRGDRPALPEAAPAAP